MKNIYLPNLLFAVLFTFQSSALQAVDFSSKDWTLSEERNGVKVYTRGVPGQKNARAIKAVTHVDQAPSSVLALVVDYPEAYRWRKQIKSMEKIKELDENNWHIKTITDLPWPLPDRISTLNCRVETSEALKSITYHFKDIETSGKQSSDDKVEKESIEGKYQFIALENGKTQVSYEIIVSSPIQVPDWLMKSMLGASTVDQLVLLRGIVNEPKYANVIGQASL